MEYICIVTYRIHTYCYNTIFNKLERYCIRVIQLFKAELNKIILNIVHIIIQNIIYYLIYVIVDIRIRFLLILL